jgi:tetratricopeptide (TPR) repeat protein
LAQHPSLAALQSFLQGELHGERRRAVLRHLLLGCGDCLQALQPAVASHFESLLAQTQALRHDEPDQMVATALNVLTIAQQLTTDHDFTEPQIADYRARATAELANALRVADRLPEAEVQMDRAFALAAAGTGDPALSLRLRDLRASLLSAQRRYPEAMMLFDEVEEAHRVAGDLHAAGRVLLAKSNSLLQRGEPQKALRKLDQALELLDPVREPALFRIAAHNRIAILIDAGHFDLASQTLQSAEDLLASGGRLDQARLLWARARIYAGLGHLALAEEALRQTLEELTALGVRAHAALAGLELATLLLHRGESAEARELAAQAVATFTPLKVRDEQLEALLVLREALQADLLTAALLRNVSDFLQRSERDPRARYRAAE